MKRFLAFLCMFLSLDVYSRFTNPFSSGGALGSFYHHSPAYIPPVAKPTCTSTPAPISFNSNGTLCPSAANIPACPAGLSVCTDAQIQSGDTSSCFSVGSLPPEKNCTSDCSGVAGYNLMPCSGSNNVNDFLSSWNAILDNFGPSGQAGTASYLNQQIQNITTNIYNLINPTSAPSNVNFYGLTPFGITSVPFPQTTDANGNPLTSSSTTPVCQFFGINGGTQVVTVPNYDTVSCATFSNNASNNCIPSNNNANVIDCTVTANQPSADNPGCMPCQLLFNPTSQNLGNYFNALIAPLGTMSAQVSKMCANVVTVLLANDVVPLHNSTSLQLDYEVPNPNNPKDPPIKKYLNNYDVTHIENLYGVMDFYTVVLSDAVVACSKAVSLANGIAACSSCQCYNQSRSSKKITNSQSLANQVAQEQAQQRLSCANYELTACSSWLGQQAQANSSCNASNAQYMQYISQKLAAEAQATQENMEAITATAGIGVGFLSLMAMMGMLIHQIKASKAVAVKAADFGKSMAEQVGDSQKAADMQDISNASANAEASEIPPGRLARLMGGIRGMLSGIKNWFAEKLQGEGKSQADAQEEASDFTNDVDAGLDV